MKIRMGEINKGKIWAIQLSRNQQRISNFWTNTNYQKCHKPHLYKAKSCKFQLIAASKNYHCSISSINLFIPEKEETIVLCIFCHHLEDIQKWFESKRKYTNCQNIQN